MPALKILALLLTTAGFVMGTRHGVKLLRSTPAQNAASMHTSLSRPATLALALSTLAGAVLLLLPQTFLLGNTISCAVILYLAAAQLRARNLRNALVELPLLLPPLLLAYLGYPLSGQP